MMTVDKASSSSSSSSSSSIRGVELQVQQHGHGSSSRPHQKLALQEDEEEEEVNDCDDDDDDDEASYEYQSANDLNMWQAAALLTADCLGTGILALPKDVQMLGKVIGIVFIVVNLPINLYVGTLLAHAAQHVEQQPDDVHDTNGSTTTTTAITITATTSDQDESIGLEQVITNGDGLIRVVKKRGKGTYSSISSAAVERSSNSMEVLSSSKTNEASKDLTMEKASTQNHHHHHLDDDEHDHHHHDSRTFDSIGMAEELFPHARYAYNIVMALFYTNIFLVLGNYILVMTHAVDAMVGEQRLCLPMAGILASTLMFGVCQLKTMANLGKSVSIISLTALAIVVVQCIIALQSTTTTTTTATSTTTTTTPADDASSTHVPPPPEAVTLLRQFSSLASIGFAVGSQKLFLNIRHEMKHRTESPKSLGISLSVFGSVYVAICLLSGPNPPSFLFDAIPQGYSRQVAGFLLWVHVAVSYAINCQAICASMDRIFAHRWTFFFGGRGFLDYPWRRWLLLTLFMAMSSYLVANAIPFFKDLVALIGALTSIPLTLILPVIFHRRAREMPLWKPTRNSIVSWLVLVFGIVFLVTGLAGALGSIELDWSKHGPPFSCH